MPVGQHVSTQNCPAGQPSPVFLSHGAWLAHSSGESETHTCFPPLFARTKQLQHAPHVKSVSHGSPPKQGSPHLPSRHLQLPPPLRLHFRLPFLPAAHGCALQTDTSAAAEDVSTGAT